MEYLDKLIKLCKDNDVEFIATTMPLVATMLVEEQESYKEAWDYFADYFHEKRFRTIISTENIMTATVTDWKIMLTMTVI